MTEEKKFVDLMKLFNVKLKAFRDPDFLYEHNIYNQDVAYSLGESSLFEFNFRNGKFIGTNTHYANSWTPRNKK